MMALIALVVPIAWAWLVLGRVIHAPALRAGIALAMGIAVPSMTTLGILAIRSRADRHFLVIDGALWTCALGIAWWHSIRNPRRSRVSSSSTRGTPAFSRWALWIALGFCAVAFIRSSTGLHGSWDAWAIWNLRARFLLRAPDWVQAFTPDLGWSHPDYPLLVPLTVMRLWAWLGIETPWIPFLLGGVFAAATLLVVIGATAMLNPPARFTAGLLLIGSPWIWQIPSQTADVPASVFFAASFALAAAAWSNKTPAMMMLSGVAASMAAWTKNEGLLFALIVLAVCLVKRERVLPWIAGALPGLLILGWFKLRLAPPSDLQQPLASMVAKIVDPLRHAAVIRSMPAAAGWWWTAPVIVFLYLVIATWRCESTRAGIAMVVLMLAGYYVVYVTTPHPQSWHVETSFGRLLAQLWPTSVLAAVAGSEVQSWQAPPCRVSANRRRGSLSNFGGRE